MPTKFLYIDDEKASSLKSLIEKIEATSNGAIEIHHTQVMESIKKFVAYISDNDYDGLLIDQDLKEKSQEGHKADYFGTTLAQQLRTEMALDNIEPMPLILMSYEEMIVNSLEPDDSAKNLFDAVFKKKDFRNPDFRERATTHFLELIRAYELAKSYQKAVGTDLAKDAVKEILDCDDKTFEYVDKRFIDYVASKASDPHALVGAIYSSLIQSAGMLVTEPMLMTKLGVSKNSEDWHQCKKLFEEYKYSGPFSRLKERWWFPRIEEWWFELQPNAVLQSMTCEERVTILKDQLNLKNLNPIATRYPNGEQSLKLWVNCVATGVPIDPFDALRVRDPEAKPWEQPKYIDLIAYTNGLDDSKKFTVHTDDLKKIKKLMVRLKPDVNA